jgi:hypothetical protein
MIFRSGHWLELNNTEPLRLATSGTSPLDATKQWSDIVLLDWFVGEE